MKEKLFSITKEDLTIQSFKSGGPGGQSQNKTDSGIRIIHKPSGAVSECREEKSQHANKKKAFERLQEKPKFKTWLSKMVYEVFEGKTVEEKVAEMMEEKNLKTEVKENGKWKKE